MTIPSNLDDGLAGLRLDDFFNNQSISPAYRKNPSTILKDRQNLTVEGHSL